MSAGTQTVFRGTCFCGAVEVEVSGPPFAQGYCHCTDCRAWSASPVNGFSLWPEDRVKVTKGQEYVASYAKMPRSQRTFCTKCGGHVMTVHPNEFVDVYASVLPGLDFEPVMHVFYQERLMNVPDGLPKYATVPAEFGGDGELIEE